MSNNPKKSVTIIDPSLIIREGLKYLVNGMAGIGTFHLASDIDSFALKNEEKESDYLIVNPAYIPNPGKIRLKEEYPFLKNTRIIALVSTYINEEILNQFDTVIYIDDARHIIQQKLEKITLSANGNTAELSDLTGLSDREKEILISLTKGKTNKEIADEHYISIHTVISHRKNITKKTGIRSVSGLTVYALLNKLIDYSDME